VGAVRTFSNAISPAAATRESVNVDFPAKPQNYICPNEMYGIVLHHFGKDKTRATHEYSLMHHMYSAFHLEGPIGVAIAPNLKLQKVRV
jgi:hypothetical protein